ncbi:mitochondrial ribosomal subunit protein-domain-containing protein [Staphylotrichum tortipilum]|uniref:Mitochondrial ribosomal subunit protein-domain-containing protein n=1 Tax=Staphylotrichum tortipilum TaxID=2831512 RepID=A0AAN6RRT4_9PEZI|nr:mitochondrial ribosomal subunit protein-domain-containing protein [Staphylotrichum longicolle]
MASSAASLLRLCLRPSRQLPRLRAAATRQATTTHRTFSTTRWRRAPPEDEAGDEEGAEKIVEHDPSHRNPGEYFKAFLEDESINAEERAAATRALKDWERLPPSEMRDFEKLLTSLDEDASWLRKNEVAKRDSFWNEDEADPDLITDELGEDDFEEDDILAMGHAKLEEHREMREYARLAVWELPLLSKLAKPFQPPVDGEILRFRYTSYMGEFHASDRKVVVEFCPADVPDLSEAQQLKLKKLAGPRYNPEKEIIKISCERFEHQAQNKRYLGDLVDKMIATAKDPTDMFEDIPLDTRHHKFKKQIKFPKEWYLTQERKQQLAAQRQQALLLDDAKREKGAMVDGMQTIQEALAAARAAAVEVPVPVAKPLGRGRR